MAEDFKKTKYFKYLLDNHAEIDKNCYVFNSEMLSLLNKQTDDLGSILKCHLIVEYYIDKYLKAAYPTIVKWKEARLTFAQKLELLSNDKTSIGIYYPAIKALNTIRNKFSHNFQYNIETKDYEEIKKIMYAWYKAFGKPLLKDIELIKDFTVWLCANIDTLTNGINKHSKMFGISGYLNWIEKMQTD
jgi:hypothetical protein